MLTISVIIKRYLCGENALKVMIHYVLFVAFLSFMKFFSELKPFNRSSTTCDRTEHGYCYFIILNARKLNGWHELNSYLEIIKERLICLTCWIFGSPVNMC